MFDRKSVLLCAGAALFASVLVACDEAASPPAPSTAPTAGIAVATSSKAAGAIETSVPASAPAASGAPGESSVTFQLGARAAPRRHLPRPPVVDLGP